MNEVIVSAPGVLIAGPDGEAEPAIELGGGVEIAHRMDDMVEATGH